MRRCPNRPFRPHRRFPVVVLPVLLSLVFAVAFFTIISKRLEPIIKTMAVSNAVNQISLAVSRAASECLLSGDVDYKDFVDIATDAEGDVTSISFRVIEGNRFREDFIVTLCGKLDEIDSETLSVPIGNLSGILWLSAFGPDVHVSVRSVGDVSAVYENEFISAGINQAKHMVYIKASVTVYLMIPGSIIPVSAEERVCVAETVIVGDVPGTYFNLQDGDG